MKPDSFKNNGEIEHKNDTEDEDDDNEAKGWDNADGNASGYGNNSRLALHSSATTAATSRVLVTKQRPSNAPA